MQCHQQHVAAAHHMRSFVTTLMCGVECRQLSHKVTAQRRILKGKFTLARLAWRMQAVLLGGGGAQPAEDIARLGD